VGVVGDGVDGIVVFIGGDGVGGDGVGGVDGTTVMTKISSLSSVIY